MSVAADPGRTLSASMSTSPDRARATPIALRVVIDGHSTSGKTSTARTLAGLLDRPVVTPEEHEGRTLWFDWLDYIGGNSDGRPIHAQVVTVPGHLPERRRLILATADVVLFVADSGRRSIAASANAFAELREFLGHLDTAPAIVVQANKRDLPDAVSIEELREALGLSLDEAVVETVAATGAGVRQAFVFAVREALQHVSGGSGSRDRVTAERPETLLATLVSSVVAGQYLGWTGPDLPAFPAVIADVGEGESADSSDTNQQVATVGTVGDKDRQPAPEDVSSAADSQTRGTDGVAGVSEEVAERTDATVDTGMPRRRTGFRWWGSGRR
jgi:signal recognition particle receptor subunit beta